MKFYTNDKYSGHEWDIIMELMQPSIHPGSLRVRNALARFDLTGPAGHHICIVQPPLWNSLNDVCETLIDGNVISVTVMKSITLQLLFALDYLHSERQLVHTGMRTIKSNGLQLANSFAEDIKPDNIMQKVYDDSIFEKFVEAELQNPSARKTVGGKVIYTSRRFETPKYFDATILCDFGTTLKGDVPRNHDIQPPIYRSPEATLHVNWSYPTDIWNLGVMVRAIKDL